MTENVEGVEVTWDNNHIYRFTDLFGDGEQYGFPPEDMRQLRDLINQALNRYHEGF